MGQEASGSFNLAAAIATIAAPTDIITQLVPDGEVWYISDVDLDSTVAQNWEVRVDGAAVFPMRQEAGGHLARSFSSPIQVNGGQTITVHAPSAGDVGGTLNGEVTAAPNS